ncbi:PerC family transcriptional regulator [Citrobacter sp. Cb016]|uniref:PerC family transcriptional regulator n=1 Tax=Citrobacter TaxID=544 RepID=UPI00258006E5|nr:PerC family transcriptional regulator [Citrobacter sp. Cb016]MDM3398757.1 PerC family transcriptional regulator [Citrobacter sp. Cb016]
MEVRDSKAEALEEKGLYRRAVARWMEVMQLCTDDDDREWIMRHREACLEKVKRPSVKVDDFGDLHKAAKETQHRMGIAQPNGNAFRLNGGKKQRQATSGRDSS